MGFNGAVFLLGGIAWDCAHDRDRPTSIEIGRPAARGSKVGSGLAWDLYLSANRHREHWTVDASPEGAPEFATRAALMKSFCVRNWVVRYTMAGMNRPAQS